MDSQELLAPVAGVFDLDDALESGRWLLLTGQLRARDAQQTPASSAILFRT